MHTAWRHLCCLICKPTLDWCELILHSEDKACKHRHSYIPLGILSTLSGGMWVSSELSPGFGPESSLSESWKIEKSINFIFWGNGPNNMKQTWKLDYLIIIDYHFSHPSTHITRTNPLLCFVANFSIASWLSGHGGQVFCQANHINLQFARLIEWRCVITTQNP